VGQFVYVIRKRIKLAPEKAIFIFVDEVLPPTAQLMSAIYEEHKYVTLIFLSFTSWTKAHTRLGTRTVSSTLATLARTPLVHGDHVVSLERRSGFRTLRYILVLS
jgi:hypothetical protein